MKKTLTLALLGLSALPACGEDRAAVCQETYRHLLDLAQRNHRPEMLDEFLELCTSIYDPKRLECFRAAQTVEAALTCRAHKKRPD